MPAFTVPTTPCPAPHPDTNPVGPVTARALDLHHYWPAPCTLVIGARGDIGASNVGELLARPTCHRIV